MYKKLNLMLSLTFIILLLGTRSVSADQWISTPDNEWEVTTIELSYSGYDIDAYGTALDEDAGLLFVNGRSGWVLAIDITSDDYEILDGFKATNCQGGDSFGDTLLHQELATIIEVDEAGGFTFINADQNREEYPGHFMYSLGTQYGCGFQHAFRMEFLDIGDNHLAVSVGTTAWPPGYARLYSVDRTTTAQTDVFSATLLDEINPGYSVHWIAVAPNNRTVVFTSFNSTSVYRSPLMVRDVIPDGSGSYEFSNPKPGIPYQLAPYRMADLEFDPEEENNRFWVSAVEDGLYEYSWWTEGENEERISSLYQTNWWPEIGTIRYFSYNAETNTLFAVTDENTLKIINLDDGTATLEVPPISIPAVSNLGHISVSQSGDTVYIPDRGGYLHIVKIRPIECPEVEDIFPDEVDEGSIINLTATATEPNGPVNFAWDFDDNGSFDIFGSPVEYSAVGHDGTSSRDIQVLAFDSVCTMDIALENGGGSGTITINNVPPEVILPDEIELIQGEFLDLSGSFSDPGAELSWTGEVDYDLGIGIQTLPLDQLNKSFRLFAQYNVPQENPYSVEVRISDGEDSGEGTIEVLVLSYQDALENSIDLINQWVDSGEVSRGNGQSLIAMIESTINAIDNENSKSNENKLEVLIHQIEIRIDNGKISLENGELLIEIVRRILATF